MIDTRASRRRTTLRRTLSLSSGALHTRRPDESDCARPCGGCFGSERRRTTFPSFNVRLLISLAFVPDDIRRHRTLSISHRPFTSLTSSRKRGQTCEDRAADDAFFCRGLIRHPAPVLHRLWSRRHLINCRCTPARRSPTAEFLILEAQSTSYGVACESGELTVECISG